MTKISMKTAVSFLLVTCVALVGVSPGANADDGDDAGPIVCSTCGPMVMNWHVNGQSFVDVGDVGYFPSLGLILYQGALGQIRCQGSSGSALFVLTTNPVTDSGPCGGTPASLTSPNLFVCTMPFGFSGLGDTIDADGAGTGACV